MSQLHVAPDEDSKEHVVSLDEECWCKPIIQDEGETKVMIHIPIDPMVPGAKLNVKKVMLLDKGEESKYVGVVDKVMRRGDA